ncbi:MAG: hypothetical protein SX243_14890 [Acidobacteriota bacterium]|nr:hypothetical protein [Acidobacteriota bacterium]
MPKTEIFDSANPPNATIQLDGDKADITAGGHGRGGDLTLRDADGKEAIRLQVVDPIASGAGAGIVQDEIELSLNTANVLIDGTKAKVEARTFVGRLLGLGDATIRMFGDDGRIEIWKHEKRAVRLDDEGNLWLGGQGQDGDVVLFRGGRTGNVSVHDATIHLDGEKGRINGRSATGQQRVRLDAEGGNLWLGGQDADGDLVLYHHDETDNLQAGKATLHLSGDKAEIIGRSPDGKRHAHLDGSNGNLWLGGQGQDGDLVLFHHDEPDNSDLSKATLHLDGDKSEIIGRTPDGKRQLRIDGARGHIWLGGHDNDGDIMLFAAGTTATDDPKKASIHLDGNAGDIILRNADCAEDFEIAPGCDAAPGTVMVLDDDGLLRPSRSGYDKRVAGVLSGAGDLRPGLVLGRTHEGLRKPLALIGRVFCQVDASQDAIGVGDLLTTAPREGHAMKATDPLKAFGSVIGKALRPLAAGRGMIPILVALQ